MEYPEAAADIVTRIGVSPQAVKALAPGTSGDALYEAVPELRAFANQAGVDFVEKPSIGTGLGFGPDGTPVLEPDANLVVSGPEAANRWFGATWLKANPEEASVMLAHTGPGLENATDSMGTIRLANGALDASVLARALNEFSPYGWHMTTKLNKAGEAIVTDLVIGGVEISAEKFGPRMQEFAETLVSEGFRLESIRVEPARIEFLEQADVNEHEVADQAERVARLLAKLRALQAKWEEEERLGTAPRDAPSTSGPPVTGQPVRTMLVFGVRPRRRNRRPRS